MADAIRVLIIDDNEDDRQLFRRLLQKDNGSCYSLREAENGEQGVAGIEESIPDCLLLDYSLPGHDGIQVLKRIRAKHPFLPVVMLTGQGSESIAVSAMSAGAQNYLSKSAMTSADIQNAVCVAIEHCALQKRIRSSEGLYSAIIEAVTNGVITINEGGIVTSFNAAAETIFGYAAAEMIGQDAKVLMSESSIGEMLGGGPRDVEGRRKAGTVFPMQLGISEVNLADRRLFVGVVEDLTARRATELQLRQAQKLDAVGQLAGGIAHDFNNLLTIMNGNLELLKERIPANERNERMLDAALRAGESSAKLTHKLLSFSRQQPVESEVCDLADLVGGMEEMFRRTLGESITVTTAVPTERWLTRVNEADFENALLNLAINSRDAMPTGGNLTIEIGGQFLDEHYASAYPHIKPGDYITVAVSDTGTGIPQHQLERVFEPFFTTKEVGKGTGLGLSMCYGFVKQSGGHIDVYSEEGRGTTVRMYLPRWDGQTHGRLKGDAPSIAPAHRHCPKVLIVDDNDDVRQVGVETLEALNCRVIEARDGVQALSLLEQHDDIDVLFTDLVMPNMNGVALATEARKRRPRLRVLFGSGFTAAATVGSHGLDSGEVFIAKPYRKADLAKKLHGVLNPREVPRG